MHKALKNNLNSWERFKNIITKLKAMILKMTIMSMEIQMAIIMIIHSFMMNIKECSMKVFKFIKDKPKIFLIVIQSNLNKRLKSYQHQVLQIKTSLKPSLPYRKQSQRKNK